MITSVLSIAEPRQTGAASPWDSHTNRNLFWPVFVNYFPDIVIADYLLKSILKVFVVWAQVWGMTGYPVVCVMNCYYQVWGCEHVWDKRDYLWSVPLRVWCDLISRLQTSQPGDRLLLPGPPVQKSEHVCSQNVLNGQLWPDFCPKSSIFCFADSRILKYVVINYMLGKKMTNNCCLKPNMWKICKQSVSYLKNRENVPSWMPLW